MKIERATAGDARRISELICELSRPFLVSSSGEGSEPFFASVSETAVRGNISAGNFSYFVATSNGQLAGVVAMRDNYHLFELFVAERFQGQGLGHKLWQLVKDNAIRSGNLGVFTVNSSLPAVPFYQRLGFAVNGAAVQAHGIAFQPMQCSPRQTADLNSCAPGPLNEENRPANGRPMTHQVPCTRQRP